MRRVHLKRRGPTLLAAAAMVLAGLAAPTAQATEQPPAPTDLEAQHVRWDSIELVWQPGTSGNPPPSWHYEITEVNTGERWISHAWVPIRPVQNLEPETTYTFEVRLVDTDRSVRSAPSNQVTVTTLARPHVNPPSNLTADAIYSYTGNFSWDPSPDPQVRYRIRNLDTGYSMTTAGTSVPIPGLWGDTMRHNPGQTYSVEVVAINSDGVASEPSNQVTFTSPTIDPPEDVTVTGDGNDVTLTWSRPDYLDPAKGRTYLIYENGRLETTLTAGAEVDGTVEFTIPRRASGQTHDYQVQVRDWLQVAGNTSDLSDPVSATVPPSDDITPPTEPLAVIEWAEDSSGIPAATFRITEQSTDDTTPQSEIRYEGLRRTAGDFYVYDYDLPLELSEGAGVSFPAGVRAVDEAGNRSAVVIPTCDDSKLDFRQC